MSVVVIDYGSGNLRSVAKAVSFARQQRGSEADVVVSADPDIVRKAERLILPGVGAFADCRRGLDAIPGLRQALTEAVLDAGRPLLGICVGMQMLADWGREHGDHAGLGWLPGDVVALRPQNPALKVPHMGWNEVIGTQPHPILAGLPEKAHGYFVHSYHFLLDNPAHLLATTDYDGQLAAMVGRDNIVGTQFHPEKSQTVGLRVIENFLGWRP
jgi:glutamine amidotransferase